MPKTPPGQLAYEAYWHSSAHGRVPVAWKNLLPHWQAQWEAAAQAVLTMQEPAPTMTPAQAMEEIRRLVGHYFAGVDVETYIQELRR
jgi:hypothetical protein